MKRGIIILVFIVLLGSFISADIQTLTFVQQLKPVYNLGETVSVPVKIIASKDISGVFQMGLVCNGTYIPFYMNGITLASGAEKNFDSSLVLIRNIIGDSKGTCKIKAILGGDYALTDSFRISDLLNIQANLEKEEFNPGESIEIKGKVTRETGENSNGFVEVAVIDNANAEISKYGTVTGGDFYINFSFPDNLKAGRYLLEIKASEKDSEGIILNTGLLQYNIFIKQIPTNLELVTDNWEIIPGDILRIKAILHDQTGENIASTAVITIKNSEGKILEQKEVNTNEFFEYLVKSDEPPVEHKIVAVSNKLTAESKFVVKTKENIDVQIANKTIIITNTGNIPYNKTLLVKIGDTPLNIDVKLSVGEAKKYIITAPDGKYNIIVSNGGEEVSKLMSLTGGTIDIRETGGSYGILAWIFLILVAGIIVFMSFRKVYKKAFFRHTSSKNKKEVKKMPILGSSVVKSGNKAELSLSIKGEKQDASIICLRIKNLKEMKSGKGSASETIQRITDLTEENKAVVYENQDYLFFMLAPAKTRTFKNEKTALEIAEKINDILKEHNKMFNQKMDYGISLNYGTIVAKLENGIFKFMSMGNLITMAKKIANLSKEEVLLSDRINDLLRLSIRTDRHVRDGVSVFSVKEIKRENEEAKKFIDRFLHRMEK